MKILKKLINKLKKVGKVTVDYELEENGILRVYVPYKIPIPNTRITKVALYQSKGLFTKLLNEVAKQIGYKGAEFLDVEYESGKLVVIGIVKK